MAASQVSAAMLGLFLTDSDTPVHKEETVSLAQNLFLSERPAASKGKQRSRITSPPHSPGSKKTETGRSLTVTSSQQRSFKTDKVSILVLISSSFRLWPCSGSPRPRSF